MICNGDLILGIKPDTVFTVGASLFVFIFGQWLMRFFEKRREKNRLRDLKEFYLTILKMLSEKVKEQASECLLMSGRLKEMKHEDFTLKIIANPHLRIIQEIDKKDSYRIFVANDKKNVKTNAELFGNLQNSLEKISVMQNHMTNQLHKLIDGYNYFVKEYRQYRNALFSIYDKLPASNAQNDFLQQPLFGIVRLVDNLNKLPMKDPFIENKEFYKALG